MLLLRVVFPHSPLTYPFFCISSLHCPSSIGVTLVPVQYALTSSLSRLPCLNQSDPAFADKVKHIRDAKARMSVVWNHCKSKNHCEPDVIEENEGEVPDEAVPVKKGHGGCGHVQPQIRKEGLKLFLQYKKTKDEDDMVCVSPEDIACFSS